MRLESCGLDERTRERILPGPEHRTMRNSTAVEAMTDMLPDGDFIILRKKRALIGLKKWTSKDLSTSGRCHALSRLGGSCGQAGDRTG